MHSNGWKIVAVLCVLGLVLGAVVNCTSPTPSTPAATSAPAAPTAAAPAPAATTAPAAPTTQPTTIAQTSGQPKSGGTLTIGYYNKVSSSLDPHLADLPDAPVYENIFSRLVQFNDKMEIVPDLAEKWDVSQDLKTYTFYLRKGVKFHNGREFTSDDVKFTFNRILTSEAAIPGKSRFTDIGSIETPDPYTVVFNMKSPNAAFLGNLTMSPSSIIPKEAVDQLKSNPIGTGPFKLSEWVQDDHLTLVKNPDYFIKGQPYLDKIVIKFITEETTRVAQIRAGNLDLAILQDPKAVKSVENTPGTKLLMVPSQDISVSFIFNTTRKPLDDVRVRQAMSLALNRQEVIDTVTLGVGMLTGPIPPGEPQWYVDPAKLPMLAPDVAKAKQLLADAGYANGLKVAVEVQANDTAKVATAQVAQAQLKQIGVNLEINPVEYGVLINDLRSGNFDLNAQVYWGRPDPDGYMYDRYYSKSAANRGKFSNAEIDDLILKGRVTSDTAERKKIYEQLQYKVAEQVPWLWFYSLPIPEVVKDSVKGYKPLPNRQFTYLRETWIDK